MPIARGSRLKRRSRINFDSMLAFDGQNNYISERQSEVFRTLEWDVSWTISCFLKLNEFNPSFVKHVFSTFFFDGTFRRGINLLQLSTGGTLRFQIAQDSRNKAKRFDFDQPTELFHFTATYDHTDQSVDIFINGRPISYSIEADQTLDGNIHKLFGEQNLQFSRPDELQTSFCNLKISHFTVLDKKLTREEVHEIFALGGKIPNSLHQNVRCHYPMNQEQGDIVYDVVDEYNLEKSSITGFDDGKWARSYKKLSGDFDIRIDWTEEGNATANDDMYFILNQEKLNLDWQNQDDYDVFLSTQSLGETILYTSNETAGTNSRIDNNDVGTSGTYINLIRTGSNLEVQVGGTTKQTVSITTNDLYFYESPRGDDYMNPIISLDGDVINDGPNSYVEFNKTEVLDNGNLILSNRLKPQHLTLLDYNNTQRSFEVSRMGLSYGNNSGNAGSGDWVDANGNPRPAIGGTAVRIGVFSSYSKRLVNSNDWQYKYNYSANVRIQNAFGQFEIYDANNEFIAKSSEFGNLSSSQNFSISFDFQVHGDFEIRFYFTQTGIGVSALLFSDTIIESDDYFKVDTELPKQVSFESSYGRGPYVSGGLFLNNPLGNTNDPTSFLRSNQVLPQNDSDGSLFYYIRLRSFGRSRNIATLLNTTDATGNFGSARGIGGLLIMFVGDRISLSYDPPQFVTGSSFQTNKDFFAVLENDYTYYDGVVVNKSEMATTSSSGIAEVEFYLIKGRNIVETHIISKNHTIVSPDKSNRTAIGAHTFNFGGNCNYNGIIYHAVHSLEYQSYDDILNLVERNDVRGITNIQFNLTPYQTSVAEGLEVPDFVFDRSSNQNDFELRLSNDNNNANEFVSNYSTAEPVANAFKSREKQYMIIPDFAPTAENGYTINFGFRLPQDVNFDVDFKDAFFSKRNSSSAGFVFYGRNISKETVLAIRSSDPNFSFVSGQNFQDNNTVNLATLTIKPLDSGDYEYSLYQNGRFIDKTISSRFISLSDMTGDAYIGTDDLDFYPGNRIFTGDILHFSFAKGVATEKQIEQIWNNSNIRHPKEEWDNLEIVSMPDLNKFENIRYIENEDFNDSSSWSLGDGWSISNGLLIYDGSAAGSRNATTIVIGAPNGVFGQKLRIDIKVNSFSRVSGTGLGIQFGTNATQENITSAGTFQFELTYDAGASSTLVVRNGNAQDQYEIEYIRASWVEVNDTVGTNPIVKGYDYPLIQNRNFLTKRVLNEDKFYLGLYPSFYP